MKKVSRSTLLPGRAVKPIFRNIVCDDFTENSQAVAAPLQDIFSQKNLVQVNSDRMTFSILRVSLKVAK